MTLDDHAAGTSGPSGEQVCLASSSADIVAPMPSNSPVMPDRLSSYSCWVMYEE